MIIKVENGITRHPDWRMAEPINLEILQGEQIAIAGDNAAGKSRLIEVLTGHFPLLMNEVKYDFSPSPLKMVSENLKYIKNSMTNNANTTKKHSSDILYICRSTNIADMNTVKFSGINEHASAAINTIAKLLSLGIYPSFLLMMSKQTRPIRNLMTGYTKASYLL